MVLADDLGWYDVGWNGAEIKTPNLDSLLHQGVLLTEFHAHSVCTPSRAALLSGRYAFHTGLQHGFIIPGSANSMPTNITLVSAMLRDEGYITHMVGKWHLGHRSYSHIPLNRGFDTFYGFLGPGIDYYTHTESGILDMWDGCSLDNSSVGSFTTSLFTRKAVGIIQRHDSKKPMFLYMAYNAVHVPFADPPREPSVDYSNTTRSTLAKLVDDLDSNIKVLVDKLVEKDMWKNTFFVFASDNGGPVWQSNSNWPMRGAKFTMWNGGVKVPAFVVHGGMDLQGLRGSGGGTLDQLVHICDLAPTFLGAAGVVFDSAQHGFDGWNLWPMLTGQRDDSALQDRHIIFNVDPVTDDEQYSGYAGIRYHSWKLTLGHPGMPDATCHPANASSVPGCHDQGKGAPTDTRNPHLWDLYADPGERNDIAATRPDVVDQLTKMLQPYLDSAWTPLPAASTEDDALFMAELAGGWAPWEACESLESCRCSNNDILKRFDDVRSGELAFTRNLGLSDISASWD